MNENDVRRVLSEKKEGFNVEAGGILHDVKYDLNVSGITKVRVINRYDVSGVTDEEFDNAKPDLFKEKRYSAEKEGDVIPKRLPLIQL